MPEFNHFFLSVTANKKMAKSISLTISLDFRFPSFLRENKHIKVTFLFFF